MNERHKTPEGPSENSSPNHSQDVARQFGKGVRITRPCERRKTQEKGDRAMLVHKQTDIQRKWYQKGRTLNGESLEVGGG